MVEWNSGGSGKEAAAASRKDVVAASDSKAGVVESHPNQPTERGRDAPVESKVGVKSYAVVIGVLRKFCSFFSAPKP